MRCSRAIRPVSGSLASRVSEQRQGTKLGDHQELRFRRGLLRKALTHLDERERHILGERRLKDNPTTLEDLSHQYGISRERVRQIEKIAIRKLQVTVKVQ